MRNRQGVTIAALIIAIVGLSIGFAAFSNTLTIRSSATLNPDSSTFRVVFSKSSSAEEVGEEHSVAPNNNTYGDGATIDNTTQGESILKDLHAKFTEPNQTVKYNLYVYNAGSYQAQLTGVAFKNITGDSAFKKCTATTKQDTTQMATQSLVNSACEGISISVKVGNKVARPGDTSLNYQILDSHTSLPVEVTVTYANGSAYADGDFEVEFGDIEINATSAVDSSLVVTPQVSPVAGTYNVFLKSDFEQIVLSDDGSAIVSAGGQSLPTTYTYDDTNNTVTIDVGQPATFNYEEISGNKVLYGTSTSFTIFATNGSTGFAPISGTYTGTHDNKEATLTFNTSGQLNGLDNDGVTGYIVINNSVYTNKKQVYFTTDDNYATLKSYYYGELESTLIKQS